MPDRNVHARSKPSLKTRVSMLSAATRVLRHSLSAREFLVVLFRYARAGKASTWDSFPPPSDEKDAGSRDQLGDAIRVYKALQSTIGRDRAIAIIHDVVKAAAIAFLHGTIPVMKRKDLLLMSPEDRRALLERILDMFPNSDGKIVAFSSDEFTFQVIRCRFPELLARLGYPELAGAFCTGDIEYFQRFQPDIEASRDTTIAAGGDRCEFKLRLKT
ncbi:MAG: L-2-amino-thiazoline-4-carboxylic acid hydrolase [Candidatus Sigynarchaeota archaeon]